MKVLPTLKMRDFAKERYLTVVQKFPILHEEKTQMYFMLSLTFLSLTFLGVFAINPTLTTITELNRKLEDSTQVQEALTTKLNNLSSLHSQYALLESSWPIVDAAVPNNPQIIYTIAQLQALAKQHGVVLIDLQTHPVQLNSTNTTELKNLSVSLDFTAQGSRDNLLQYLSAISSFDRLLTIDTVSLAQTAQPSLSIEAAVHYLP